MESKPASLEWLEPPDGGLDRVYDRIRQRHHRRAVVAGLGTLALLVGVMIGTQPFSAPPVSESLLARIEARAQHPDIRIANGAALELQAPETEGRVYLVWTDSE